MWIAFGHQRPHANVTPSSFVEPNVPFRMCHETSASQFPVVGSASKLHGHPHAQLQLWMYSASKFHFVGIDRTSYGPGLVIGPRLLNRARRPPVGLRSHRFRTFISPRPLPIAEWSKRPRPSAPGCCGILPSPLLRRSPLPSEPPGTPRGPPRTS